MKTLSILFLALIIHIPVWCLAQKVDSFRVEYGETFNDDTYFTPPHIVGADESGYYMFQSDEPLNMEMDELLSFRPRQKRFVLRKFNHELSLEESIEFSLGRKEEIPLRIEMGPDNQIFLFSLYPSRRQHFSRLFLRRINREDLSIPDEGEQIVNIAFSEHPSWSPPSIDIRYSRDSSKIVVHHIVPGKWREKERVAIYVFSDNMAPLWNKEFELDYDRDLFEGQRLRIGNDAKVYMLGKIYHGTRKERKGKEANYNFKVLQFAPDQEKPVEIDLSLEGRFIAGMNMGIGPNGNLACVGMYNEGSEDEIKGLYFSTIDGASNKIIAENSEPLKASMFQVEKKNAKPKSDRKESRELAEYKFNDIILRTDGGALIIGEKKRIDNRAGVSDPTGGYSSSKQSFLYGDIVILHINPEGEIENIHVIAKGQYMIYTDIVLSYGLIVNGSQAYFIYNDMRENLNLPEGQLPIGFPQFNSSDHFIALTSLDTDGTLIRHEAHIQIDKSQSVVPKSSTKVSPTEIILVLRRTTKKRLGRITLNK